MKQNTKFFTTVISLLLISVLILTGCMYTIASDKGKPKAYGVSGQEGNMDINNGDEVATPDNIVEDAPMAQAPMLSKFDEYLHQDGKNLIIFSDEQYETLKAMRDEGTRTPLTYEEIIYLVNDSIGMYFSYDKICLYNANVDCVLPPIFPQSSSSCIIKPYHGDYTEFEAYSDALTRYERVVQEIYAIIYYRIYMHDAGFETVQHTHYLGGDYVFGNRYNAHYGEESRAVPVGKCQMLAIDGASFSGVENEEKLVNEYGKILQWEREQTTNRIDADKEIQDLNSKVLKTQTANMLRQIDYTFYIYESAGAVQKIYPTQELTATKPKNTVTYRADVPDRQNVPVFSLTYDNRTFSMSAHEYFSFAIVGAFDEHDGVLKLYPQNAGDDTVYSYVFHKINDGYIYVPNDSKPIETAGFDWHEEIVFEIVQYETPSTPDEPSGDGVMPLPPEADGDVGKKDPAALKFVSDSDYCSLMYQGGSVIDGGSYEKDDEKMVFLFKTSYGVCRYYFEHLEADAYVYVKEKSTPVPGYEFEAETKFVLTEFDNTTSCYLEVDDSECYPTSTEAGEFERYYHDELYYLYDLSKLVSWKEIYDAEKELSENNAYFNNEQLPPLYLMIKQLDIGREDFVKVADDVSAEQIEWLFSDADTVDVMINLKADWAFHYKGRLYNIFELAELDKDLLIELREKGDLDEYIAYMESLDVEFEALEVIKSIGK